MERQHRFCTFLLIKQPTVKNRPRKPASRGPRAAPRLQTNPRWRNEPAGPCRGSAETNALPDALPACPGLSPPSRPPGLAGEHQNSLYLRGEKRVSAAGAVWWAPCGGCHAAGDGISDGAARKMENKPSSATQSAPRARRRSRREELIQPPFCHRPKPKQPQKHPAVFAPPLRKLCRRQRAPQPASARESGAQQPFTGLGRTYRSARPRLLVFHLQTQDIKD